MVVIFCIRQVLCIYAYILPLEESCICFLAAREPHCMPSLLYDTYAGFENALKQLEIDQTCDTIGRAVYKAVDVLNTSRVARGIDLFGQGMKPR